jgi:transposase
MGFRTFDRSQIHLLGYSLDDMVESDAKCRFVVQLISMLQLDKLYQSYSDVGADANDPSAMLCAWFLAYSEGITSSRNLEKHCKRDTHFMYASSNLRPDHTTLNRFRKRHLTLISEYFVQIIQLAQEKRISDFKHITIDGTKIQASSSPRKSKDTEALDRYLSAVRKNISEYMKRCDESDQLEDEVASGDIQSIRKELQRLKDLEKTLIERKDELEQRKQQIKKEHQQTHQINITEPEAFNMRHANGKQTLPAYNTQAGVDSKTHLIVAADVVQDRADLAQFSVQHQAIENNLGKDPERRHTADAGYHNLDQLEYIEEHQIDAVVCDPNPQHRSLNKTLPTVKELLKSGRRLERSDFIYHSQKDTYECPSGQIIDFSHTQQKADKRIRLYKTSHCAGCLLCKQCLSKKNKTKIRKIQRDEREVLAEQMAIKLSTDEAKQRLIVRKTTVEPVFGNLKENLGFRRFSLRGLENVRNEFKLMATAHNINKLFKIMNTLITSVEEFLSSIFAPICLRWRIA